MLVCINRLSTADARIREWCNFCDNVLSHDQIDIAKQYAEMAGTTHDRRFAQGNEKRWITGAPALAGYLVNFDCRL